MPESAINRLKYAMKEVHHNIPLTVKKSGKKGKAKEKMLAAIAFSKSGMSKKKKRANEK